VTKDGRSGSVTPKLRWFELVEIYAIGTSVALRLMEYEQIDDSFLG
jgi:hypothetical protein